ncbi:MAG: molybdopterin converting factor subunit 1 [Crocinitomicaceae bacterium]|nr:molybdopterin converting factor subunit 1 [Crocinitomicaceae bacterium]
MTVRLLIFGIAHEIAGKRSTTFEVPDNATVSELRSLLSLTYPQLGPLSFAIAVNQQYVEDSVILTENDEVAIIPPVSGG